jgi:DNA-binding XRE family transcriptional regulator
MTNNQCLVLRDKRGYSQQQLSIMAGISPATLVAIERYGYVPGPWVRRKLARALRVSESRIWPGLDKNSEVSRK